MQQAYSNARKYMYAVNKIQSLIVRGASGDTVGQNSALQQKVFMVSVGNLYFVSAQREGWRALLHRCRALGLYRRATLGLRGGDRRHALDLHGANGGGWRR
jgi:hypothetical protein